jgi:malonate transporter and related proteins
MQVARIGRLAYEPARVIAPILDVVLPVFSLVLAGYLAGRLGLLGGASSEALNRFVYWMALPALLFVAMTRVPVREVFNIPFLVAFAGGMTACFLASMAGNALLYRDRLADRTLRSIAGVFANVGYMGVPIYLAAFGAERALPALIATVFVVAVAVAVTVTLIEIDLSRAGGKPHIARDVAAALLRNPLVMAPLAGLLVSAVGIILPKPLATFCDLLGAAAAPCGLFALGLFMVGKPLAGRPREIAPVLFMKLVMQPLATWVIAFKLLEMDPFWAASAVVLSALPTGALVFTVAQYYGFWVAGASASVLLSTILSLLTVSAAIVLTGLR